MAHSLTLCTMFRWRNLDGDAAIAQLKRRLRHILKDEARAARVKEKGTLSSDDSADMNNAGAARTVAKELLKVDKDGCTALHHASFGVPAAAVGALVKSCPAMAAVRDNDGLVPLHYCVRFGLPGAVEKVRVMWRRHPSSVAFLHVSYSPVRC